VSELLIKVERSRWSARTTVGAAEGPPRWVFEGADDVFRGRVAALVLGVLGMALLFLPMGVDLGRSWMLVVAGWVIVSVVGDRLVFGRFALRDARGRTVVRATRRIPLLGTRFRLEGEGGLVAELDVRAPRLEVAGRPAIEIRGAPAQGWTEYVADDEILARTTTWSADREASLNLRIAAGPLDTLIVTAIVLVDRGRRARAIAEPIPG